MIKRTALSGGWNSYEPHDLDDPEYPLCWLCGEELEPSGYFNQPGWYCKNCGANIPEEED